MPLKSGRLLRERAAAGVVVCTTHGPSCQKYPDRGHPDSVPDRMDMELAEMIKRGREQRGLPPSGPQEPQPCKTRKLSDDELRQRREYADAVREARQKRQAPPRPPWVNPEADRELIEKIHRLRLESCPQYRGMYGPEAMERYSRNVREGYGNAVPEFEE